MFLWSFYVKKTIFKPKNQQQQLSAQTQKFNNMNKIQQQHKKQMLHHLPSSNLTSETIFVPKTPDFSSSSPPFFASASQRSGFFSSSFCYGLATMIDKDKEYDVV